MAVDNSITLTDHMLTQITENQMISLDIEGAVRNVTQISIINGNGAELYNQMTPFLPFPKGHSEEQHKIIQGLLDQAVYIIGFGINSDLKILSEAGFFIRPDAKCIDVAGTFDWMKRMRLVDKKQVAACNLKGVAEYFGIKAIQGYHMSNVDATVTLEVFKKMYDLNKGYFCIVKPKIATKEDNMIRLPSASVPVMKEETSYIYKINNNLYEGLLTIEGTKIVVRLTADEYKLYERICRYEPCYTLELFFNTIMNPAEVRKIEAMMEEDLRREREERQREEAEKIRKQEKSLKDTMVQNAEQLLETLRPSDKPAENIEPPYEKKDEIPAAEAEANEEKPVEHHVDTENIGNAKNSLENTSEEMKVSKEADASSTEEDKENRQVPLPVDIENIEKAIEDTDTTVPFTDTEMDEAKVPAFGNVYTAGVTEGASDRDTADSSESALLPEDTKSGNLFCDYDQGSDTASEKESIEETVKEASSETKAESDPS